MRQKAVNLSEYRKLILSDLYRYCAAKGVMAFLQDVSIDATYGGKSPGIPTIGDNAYLGPGAKIIGGITLGSNVAVGANCVVNIDVPDSGVVIGNPCRIVSYRGSKEYIVNTAR